MTLKNEKMIIQLMMMDEVLLDKLKIIIFDMEVILTTQIRVNFEVMAYLQMMKKIHAKLYEEMGRNMTQKNVKMEMKTMEMDVTHNVKLKKTTSEVEELL